MATRHYEKLNPRERLALLAEAWSRGDKAEARRLHDTAPTKTYRCPEVEFDLPFRVLWQMVYLLSIKLNEYIGRADAIMRMHAVSPVMMLQAVREAMFSHLLHPEPSADSPSDDSTQIAAAAKGADVALSSEERELPPSQAIFFPEASAEVDGIFERWYEKEMRHAASIFLSFDRFTRQILDVDGMTVLRAWMPQIADDVEALGIPGYDPDPAKLEQWGETWAEIWNHKLEFHLGVRK